MNKGPSLQLKPRPSWLAIGLYVLLALATEAAHAAGKDLEMQRANFLKAEKALEDGDLASFLHLKAGLEDYPLYPYLVYGELRRRLETAPESEVTSALERYASIPFAWRLSRQWLRELAAKAEWQTFLRNYRPTKDVELRCHRVRALLETGATKEAFDAVEPLWLSGRSQPNACDPVFERWRATGGMTQSHAWHRLRLAMEAGNPRLANYLTRFLNPKLAPWGKLWIAARKKPEVILTAALLEQSPPPPAAPTLRDDIVVYGLRRMARRDIDAALQAWRTIGAKRPLAPPADTAVRRALGLWLARDFQIVALEHLGAIPDADAPVREWRVLVAMRHHRWGEALEWMDRLDETERASERWRYWRARASFALGKKKLAIKLFTELAGERSYYGFLAADRLGLPYQLNHRPLTHSNEALAALLAMPGMQRAHELFKIRRRLDARREWLAVTADMEDQDLARAAEIAHRWGWHGRAIMTLGKTPWLDNLELRFPVAYRDTLLRQAKANTLDPSWVYALTRQESAFMPDARSSAGALGLMQIMPTTGKSIAKSLKTRLSNRSQLLNVDTNIRFGTHYLRSLLDRFDNNPILVTAAYNAGARRVRGWLPQTKALSADLWIETVPFSETRSYLRSVFAYTVIYQQRLGKEAIRLSERFRPIPAKT